MNHLGDITRLCGREIEPVDVITFGSPCQGLSLAGKRLGLSDERSGLFMEAVRIIREMEEATNGRYPTFAVWENVPGAFSSGKKEDFRAVLEELAKIKDPGTVIPRPPKRWTNAGCIVADGWSIAWRVFDAQFWGVPQRRRRIALVVDFRGCRAPEILFERKSVFGNSSESAEAWEGAASRIEGGVNPAVARTIKAKSGLSFRENADTLIFQEQVIPINDKATRYSGGGNSRNGDGSGNGLGIGNAGDPSPTLTAGDRHAIFALYENHAQDSRISGALDVAPTVHRQFGTGGNNLPPVMVTGLDCRNGTENNERCATLQAKESGGFSLNAIHPVRIGKIVRRLTPLECERLQGFPDDWTNIPDYTDSKGKKRKVSDSARYRALGNSIALPPWKWVLKRVSACFERDATLGSLFDGIGGFPFIWEQFNGKGSARWASEIEELCTAVTKYHFGGH